MNVARHLGAAATALALQLPVFAAAQTDPLAQRAPRIDIDPHVAEASQRFGIPRGWIYAVIRIESAGRVRAISSAGAMGLMQLMPGTWARQRARFALGGDPFDPRDNIHAGTSYLREMYDLYGAPGFLAAYNAGPGRYEDWLAGRRSLPLETRRYVARLAPLLRQPGILAAAPGRLANAADASFVPHGGTEAATESGEDAPPRNPFARSLQPAHDLFAPVSTPGER